MLGFVEHGVGLGHLGRGLANRHAARDIRAVAGTTVGGHGPAEVAQDHLARLDHPLVGLVVGASGVGTAGHNREIHSLMALVEQAPTDVRGYLGLGSAHKGDLTTLQLSRHPIGCGGRAP